MKRKIIFALVSVFFILTALMVFRFVKTVQAKESITAMLQSLPVFAVTDTNGISFSEKEFPKEHWVVFVFFHSECYYCQSEAEQLKEMESELANITFIWISSEELGAIKAFQETYKLEQIPFVVDVNSQLSNTWNISATPQFLVYTPQQKLFKNHKGAWRIENLISQIHEIKIP